MVMKKKEQLTVTLVDSMGTEISLAQTARICRSPEPLAKLREDVRPDKAQNTMSRIVRKEHDSIGEHAAFTFDICNISRIALETIQSFKFASFTECSQRHVKVNNKLYSKISEALYALDKNRVKAQEDARYCLSLKTKTQLVMSVNARELIRMVNTCLASKQSELRDFGDKVMDACRHLEPTLFKGVLKNGYHVDDTPLNIPNYRASVVLERCNIQELDDEKAYCLDALEKRKKRNDDMPTEFGHYHLTFVLRLSASAYAQLKRHRVANKTKGRYRNDFETPTSFLAISKLSGTLDEYKAEVQKNEATNASIRNMKITFNLADFYNFCRLRMDGEAQWEVRELATAMAQLAQEVAPTACCMLCGNDKFSETYLRNFKKFNNNDED